MEEVEDKELRLLREQTRGAVAHVREDLRQLKRVLLLEQLAKSQRWDKRHPAPNRDVDDEQRGSQKG